MQQLPERHPSVIIDQSVNDYVNKYDKETGKSKYVLRKSTDGSGNIVIKAEKKSIGTWIDTLIHRNNYDLGTIYEKVLMSTRRDEDLNTEEFAQILSIKIKKFDINHSVPLRHRGGSEVKDALDKAEVYSPKLGRMLSADKKQNEQATQIRKLFAGNLEEVKGPSSPNSNRAGARVPAQPTAAPTASAKVAENRPGSSKVPTHVFIVSNEALMRNCQEMLAVKDAPPSMLIKKNELEERRAELISKLAAGEIYLISTLASADTRLDQRTADIIKEFFRQYGKVNTWMVLARTTELSPHGREHLKELLSDQSIDTTRLILLDVEPDPEHSFEAKIPRKQFESIFESIFELIQAEIKTPQE